MSASRSIGPGEAREGVAKAAVYDAALLEHLWQYLRPYARFARPPDAEFGAGRGGPLPDSGR